MSDINSTTREELLALPVRKWDERAKYDSLAVISSGDAHDSGWARMVVVGVRNGVPVEIASDCTDDIEWLVHPMAICSQIRNDCAIASGALHFWSHQHKFSVGHALSSLTINLIPREEDKQ